MIKLGIIVLNIEQEKTYFKKIAQFGKSYGVTTSLFLPNNIHFEDRTFNGFQYCSKEEKWIEGTYSLPDYVYDRCFYKDKNIYEYYAPYVSWLKNEQQIQFLGYGLPNKWYVYEQLKGDPYVSKFLPSTTLLAKPEDIFKEINMNGAVIIKPINGSQGKGIFVIKGHSTTGYLLLAKKNDEPIVKRLRKSQIEHFIYKITHHRSYIIQPFLRLTSNNRPFDIRVLVQKNHLGKWNEVGRGIRLGKEESFTSNINSGGEVNNYEQWIDTLSQRHKECLEYHLTTLAVEIPKLLERKDHSLFEVGLDFGYDTSRKLWLLEVNSKPGRKVIEASLQSDDDMLAKAPIHYCLYLNNDGNRKEVGSR